MLDFSFTEILLCFVVALVVLGPERMPGVVRSLGRWAGKARGYMRTLSAELERETQLGEMKRQIEDAHRVLRDQSSDMRRTVEADFRRVKDDLGETAKSAEVSAAVEPMKPLAAPVPSTPDAGREPHDG